MNLFKRFGFLVFFVILSIPFESIAQENKPVKLHQLSGIINDSKQRPMPFVHVLVKNYRRGTISDFEGFFSIVVQAKDTILFSSMGYKKQIWIVPDTALTNDLYVQFKLETDTIILSEAIVFPWNTYEKFREAFVQLNVPSDDIERALTNFALIEKQLLNDYSGEPNASLSYKYFMQQTYNQLYYAGQLPPNNLLNPIAWSKFFQALKNGDFKRKD